MSANEYHLPEAATTEGLFRGALTALLEERVPNGSLGLVCGQACRLRFVDFRWSLQSS